MADPAVVQPATLPQAAPIAATPPLAAAVETPAAAAPPVAVAPPASSPTPAPVVQPPVQDNAVSRETKPEPAVEIKAVEPAKPTEAAPAETKTPSLLAEAKPPEKPVEAKPAEVKPEPPKAPEPLKYEFKFPEGVTLDKDRITPYAEILGKNQVPPEAAQQLVDLYVQERTRELTAQRENWEKTQRALQDEFKKDPEIGGAKWESTIQDCGAVLNWFGQKHGAEHEQSLRNAFVATGLGNHAEFIRLLADFSQYVAEKGKPVAATAPAPMAMGKAQRRYPTMQPTNGAA